MTSKTVLRDLGNSLVLRRVTQADTEPLAAFQTQNMHFPMGFHIREWLRGDHPTSALDGFTLVEETTSGDIVSAACLLPQTLTYAGILFAAGRAEAVATCPDYRRRGLVRMQFEELHQWAGTQGQRLQIVEGATWLYRDFGYQPALDNNGGMNSGGRVVLRSCLPRLAGGEPEPFVARLATPSDLAFVRDLFTRSRSRYCLSVVEIPSVWEFLLRGGEPGYNRWYDLRVIWDRENQPVGFVVHDPWGCGRVMLYEVRDGVSWLAVTPSVIRAVYAECDRIAEKNKDTFNGVAFSLAPGHPVFEVAAGWLTPLYDQHCEWGIRVPDMPGFVRHIASALDNRLAASPVAGHTGELRLNFYRSGLRLNIVDGRITEVEAWTPANEGDGDAGFTGNLFTPLLFGHRTLDDLREMDRDCWARNYEATVLLNALFPKQSSHVMALA